LFDRETVGVQATDGADVIALAFTADSYSRTYRSHAVTLGSAPVRTSDGLLIVPEQGAKADVVVDLPVSKPVHALETAVRGVEARYGRATGAFVRVQLEDRGHTAGG